MDAIINPSKRVLHIPKTLNALVFVKSLCEIDDVFLSPVESHVSLCVTFLVLGEQDQTIISDRDDVNPTLPFREISAANKEIRI